MANATALTIIDLIANGTATATGDLVTNGTNAVTLAGSVGGLTERCVLLVTNDNTSATQTLSVAVLGDDNPPPYKSTLAGKSKTGIATAACVAFGPFNAGLFSCDGSLKATFTPASSGTLKFTARLLRLPSVV